MNTTVKNGGIYVKFLVPGGPADMCALILVGDRVVSVNGEELIAVTHKEAVEVLRNAGDLIKLVMERGEGTAATGPAVRVSTARPETRNLV